MNKDRKSLIEYISSKYDWFERMQKPLGHHSWWYTNRSPEDCVNVKIHAWADIEAIKSKLNPKTLEIANKIGFDIEEYVEEMIWGDFGMVDNARRFLKEELTCRYRVKELEYGGRSGGWLCVVYNWDDIPDDYDRTDWGGEPGNYLYSYKELVSFKKIIEDAEAEVAEVNELVDVRKRELCEAIKDPTSYIDQLEERINDSLEDKRSEAKRILAIS